MSSEQTIIDLKNHRWLIAGSSMARVKSKRWIVFIPESGSDFREGSRQELATLIGGKLAKKFNFLVVNKSGLSPDFVDKVVYENSFRRPKRIEDTLKTLKIIIPKNHQIFLIGYSEGAYLAPQVAQLDSRIKSVCMIGGGTRGWLKEELANARPKEKSLYKNKMKEILKNPSSAQKWNGFSHATWASYRGDNTLQALKKIKVPTISILGARDRVIDLKSTIVDLMLVSERKPIQLHVFGDCGHYFTKHWHPVSRVLSRFLTEQIS